MDSLMDPADFPRAACRAQRQPQEFAGSEADFMEFLQAVAQEPEPGASQGQQSCKPGVIPALECARSGGPLGRATADATLLRPAAAGHAAIRDGFVTQARPHSPQPAASAHLPAPSCAGGASAIAAGRLLATSTLASDGPAAPGGLPEAAFGCGLNPVLSSELDRVWEASGLPPEPLPTANHLSNPLWHQQQTSEDHHPYRSHHHHLLASRLQGCLGTHSAPHPHLLPAAGVPGAAEGSGGSGALPPPPPPHPPQQRRPSAAGLPSQRQRHAGLDCWPMTRAASGPVTVAAAQQWAVSGSNNSSDGNSRTSQLLQQLLRQPADQSPQPQLQLLPQPHRASQHMWASASQLTTVESAPHAAVAEAGARPAGSPSVLRTPLPSWQQQQLPAEGRRLQFLNGPVRPCASQAPTGLLQQGLQQQQPRGVAEMAGSSRLALQRQLSLGLAREAHAAPARSATLFLGGNVAAPLAAPAAPCGDAASGARLSFDDGLGAVAWSDTPMADAPSFMAQGLPPCTSPPPPQQQQQQQQPLQLQLPSSSSCQLPLFGLHSQDPGSAITSPAGGTTVAAAAGVGAAAAAAAGLQAMRRSGGSSGGSDGVLYPLEERSMGLAAGSSGTIPPLTQPTGVSIAAAVVNRDSGDGNGRPQWRPPPQPPPQQQPQWLQQQWQQPGSARGGASLLEDDDDDDDEEEYNPDDDPDASPGLRAAARRRGASTAGVAAAAGGLGGGGGHQGFGPGKEGSGRGARGGPRGTSTPRYRDRRRERLQALEKRVREQADVIRALQDRLTVLRREAGAERLEEEGEGGGTKIPSRGAAAAEAAAAAAAAAADMGAAIAAARAAAAAGEGTAAAQGLYIPQPRGSCGTTDGSTGCGAAE